MNISASISGAVGAVGAKIGFNLDKLAQSSDRQAVNEKIEEMDSLAVEEMKKIHVSFHKIK